MSKKPKKKTQSTTDTKKLHVEGLDPMLLTKPVQVNFSEQHKEAIQAAANAQGIALAQFIRQAAIKAAVK